VTNHLTYFAKSNGKSEGSLESQTKCDTIGSGYSLGIIFEPPLSDANCSAPTSSLEFLRDASQATL